MCLIKDQEEDYESAIFQCLHHQFIANALTVKLAREILPEPKMGGMIARFTTYPATCKPEDVLETLHKEQYSNYFYTDIMVRGEYPAYVDRYFHDNGIVIQKAPGDDALLKAYTVYCREWHWRGRCAGTGPGYPRTASYCVSARARRTDERGGDRWCRVDWIHHVGDY
ncbi:hypothetical protein NUBL21983_48050 [Klebsiella variicola]|nr:hypothetical protein NUBL21983_48050 [Klebsiella variicola]